MNVRRCKFFEMGKTPRQPIDWDAAEDGWFMGLFQDGDSPIAIVEGFDGRMHRTFIESVCFMRTELDVLMDTIMEEAEKTTVKSKWSEMQKFIRDQFTKHAFTR